MKIKLTNKEAVALTIAVRKRLDDIGPAHPDNDTLHDLKDRLMDIADFGAAARSWDNHTSDPLADVQEAIQRGFDAGLGPRPTIFVVPPPGPPRRTEAWFEPGVGWHPPDPDPRISPPR